MQLILFQAVKNNYTGNIETLLTLFRGYIAVDVQIGLFVLIGTPQSFDKDTLTPDAFSVVSKAARHRNVCYGNIEFDVDQVKRSIACR